MRLGAMLLLIALGLLAACGGGDEEKAAAPAKPSVTPFPSIDRPTSRRDGLHDAATDPRSRSRCPTGRVKATSADGPTTSRSSRP